VYKKGVAIELQFSAARLTEQTGKPFSIGLNADEARSIFKQLKVRLAASATAAPIVVSLDGVHDEAPTPATVSAAGSAKPVDTFKQWVCVICGWVYDEEAGLPEEGIAPGTRFEAIPDDWRCPLCDVGKEDFVVVEF
jgi:rubredoxin